MRKIANGRNRGEIVYPRQQEDDNVKKWVACVAWRFCRAERRSGVAARFAREARENGRRSREKNKNRLPRLVAFSTAAPFNSF